MENYLLLDKRKMSSKMSSTIIRKQDKLVIYNTKRYYDTAEQ